MDINVLKRTDNEIVFLVDNISSAFANSLRRTMISEVPTMAIETIDFIKNDSAMPDELLANRLGQIPLTFDKRAYNLPENCKCGGKGCSRCQVKLTLQKRGPSMVYSDDLKCRNKDVEPVFKKIPIVELFEDQELIFEAYAQLGVGKDHAKWQAAVVGYKNVPVIKLNVKKDFEKYVNICPRHVFEIKENKLVVANPLDCNLCMECVDAANENEIKVETNENSFVFNVESVSGLTPEEIVYEAISVLENKVKDFSKSLRKIK